jgi:hypothetical protein
VIDAKVRGLPKELRTFFIFFTSCSSAIKPNHSTVKPVIHQLKLTTMRKSMCIFHSLIVNPFVLLALLISVRGQAQEPQRQFGLGMTSSFLPKNKMLKGQIGLEQIPQTTIWADFNKAIKRSGKKLRWGLSASVNYEKYFYDIDQPLPYYTPEKDKYAFLAAGIKNVELYGYVSSLVPLYRSEKWRVGLHTRLGPVFHINPFPAYTESSAVLNASGVPFPLYDIAFERPEWYVPYLRGMLSLELVKRFSSGLELGISPMLSFTAFSQDYAFFLTVPQDQTYRSLGEFKIKRGFYGINLIIGK